VAVYTLTSGQLVVGLLKALTMVARPLKSQGSNEEPGVPAVALPPGEQLSLAAWRVQRKGCRGDAGGHSTACICSNLYDKCSIGQLAQG
jgi:hypothetical protein